MRRWWKRLLLSLLSIGLWGCGVFRKQERSIPVQTTIIQKDTTIFTPVVKVDTVLYTLTDTVQRRNVFVAYKVDTQYKRVRLIIQTQPETLRVRQVYKEEVVTFPPPQKEKRKEGPSAFWVGVFSALATLGMLLLLRLLSLFLQRAS